MTVLEIFFVSYSWVVTSVIARTEHHVTGGVPSNINKYDVGFSGDWGSLKRYVAKVGIPLSEWPLSGDLPNIVIATVEKTGKFHLALYL